jgi:hypothetical protein
MKSAPDRPLPFLIVASLALFLLAPSTAGAAAKYQVAAKIVVNGTQTRVVVTLSSTKKVTSKYRPSSVKVKAAGKSLKLSKAKSPKTALKYLTTWQSKNQTGSYAEKLKALAGKKVKVTTSARAGALVKSPKATVENAPVGGGGGGGGGGGPIFAAPASDLVGLDAWNVIAPSFQNSAFSDCAAGPWPNCAVEHRYVHCPNFSWRYMRTAGLGSDINSHDTYTVSGANANANGTWAVQYQTGTGGNYLWQGTNTSGIVSGTYQYGGDPAENLGQFYWFKPATAWDQLSGAC